MDIVCRIGCCVLAGVHGDVVDVYSKGAQLGHPQWDDIQRGALLDNRRTIT